MTRVNLADGQYRDLSKPLVEVDPKASRGKRMGQRALKVYLGIVVISTLALAAMTTVALLVSSMKG